jgi:hypothetical protein
VRLSRELSDECIIKYATNRTISVTGRSGEAEGIGPTKIRGNAMKVRNSPDSEILPEKGFFMEK